MEFFESLGWIALGFVPTLLGLELAFRGTKRFIFSTKRRTIMPIRREETVEVPF